MPKHNLQKEKKSLLHIRIDIRIRLVHIRLDKLYYSTVYRIVSDEKSLFRQDRQRRSDFDGEVSSKLTKLLIEQLEANRRLADEKILETMQETSALLYPIFLR